MRIRKSKLSDIEAIMRLVHQAQNYFKNANIDPVSYTHLDVYKRQPLIILTKLK